MTDTEAKAQVRNLVLIATNKALPDHYRDYATGAAHYIEATEARHAAELREQAERFSDALKRYYGDDGCQPHSILSPFILPKPDPLVEVIAAALREASPFADDGHDYTAEAKVAAAAVRAHQKDTDA